jgi:hypothetical protein
MSRIADHENDFSAGFRAGWDKGWDAHESFVEQKLMERDPAFLTWLDKLNRLSLVARERDELALQQQQWALQQAHDDTAH